MFICISSWMIFFFFFFFSSRRRHTRFDCDWSSDVCSSDLLMAPARSCVVVPETERLDRFLADQLALSGPVAAGLIADKRVTRDGRPLRPSALLERGAVVTVELPPDAPVPLSYAPAHRDLTFAYEDEHLAVLDKPAGLVVHPRPRHWDDTPVNVLVERGTALAQGATEGRPGIVHRLDRDTSGLLLVAKTDLAHRRLTRMIERREVERVYAALAWGHFARSEEHTSELQSQSNLVCRLLLEKKKKGYVKTRSTGWPQIRPPTAVTVGRWGERVY